MGHGSGQGEEDARREGRPVIELAFGGRPFLVVRAKGEATNAEAFGRLARLLQDAFGRPEVASLLERHGLEALAGFQDADVRGTTKEEAH